LGIPPHALVQDFLANQKRTFIEDPPEEPELYSGQFAVVGTEFPDANIAMAAAKTIAVTEIAKEPLLRKEIRRLFKQAAVVSVKPTEKGITKIDEMHPYYVRLESLISSRFILTLLIVTCA
jgi:transcription elongation factor SPT6